MFLTVQSIPGGPFVPPRGTPPDEAAPPAHIEALFPEPADGTKTYAVLDAAKIQGLPDLLASSGLRYACLFNGDAVQTYGDVAPWIVEMAPGHSFLTSLLTSNRLGTAPSGLWDKEPGIFIRFPGDLKTLQRHLRQFTKVRDESGTMVYFRFYEDWVLTSYLTAVAEMPERLIGLVFTRDGVPLQFVTRDRVITPTQKLEGCGVRRAAPVIDAPVRKAFRDAKWARFLDRLAPAVQDENDEAVEPATVRSIASDAFGRGYRSERAIFSFTCAAIEAQRHGIAIEGVEHFVDPTGRLSPAERSDALLQAVRNPEDFRRQTNVG